MKWFSKKTPRSLDLEEVLGDTYRQDFFADETLEGSMSLSISKTSIYGVIGLVCLASSVFLYRAFSLQVLEYDTYIKRSLNNNFTAVPLPSLRGSILDRTGEVMVKTEKVSSQEVDGYKRVYVDSEGLGNVLGFVSYPKKDISGKFWQDNFKGVEGIEAYYDQLLSGKSGVTLYEKSAEGKKRESFVAEPAVNGKDVTLSLDADLQRFAYNKTREFVEKNGLSGGAGVIMDIHTGEVLMLVSYPTYDPRLLLPFDDTDSRATGTEMTRGEYYASLENNPKKPFLNRAISGIYPPGSIVKPVFGLAALDSGVITPVTSIFSSGQIEVPSQVPGGKPAIFRDWGANGWTNVAEAIAVSSDVFFYSVIGGYQGQKGIGIRKLDEYAHAFHFDQETGIDLYGEKKGTIPTPEWKQKIFNEDWRLGDTYNSSIGQYGFTLTPIAAAKMVAAVANGGILVTPKLLMNTSGTDNDIQQKVAKDISKEWYSLVRRGMRMTVTDGTAKILNLPYVAVAAKTGTAEIGTTKQYVHSWITGFFPYEEPRYAFIIITEKAPRNDAQSPAFIMRDILEWMSLYRHEYLGLSQAREHKPEVDTVIESATTTENVATGTGSVVN